MGRPRTNIGFCSRCQEFPSWTKQLCRRCYKVDYYASNRNVESEKRRLYNKKSIKQICLRKQQRQKEDVNYKLANALRSRLNKAIKNSQKVGSAIKDLGCSIEELKKHLESKFKPGMSWDNWSKDGWHIDHVEPLASFDLSNAEQFKKACHYSNLQPLWAFENLRKGDKIGC